MHELSIALNIIDIVNDTFAKAKAERVNDIELEIGKFSGIELNALEFALQTSMTDIHLKNAKVEIITLDGKGICKNCKNEFIMKTLYDECPVCKSFDVDIIEGQELKVKSINVD